MPRVHSFVYSCVDYGTGLNVGHIHRQMPSARSLVIQSVQRLNLFYSAI